jgi:hypothetical protein
MARTLRRVLVNLEVFMRRVVSIRMMSAMLLVLLGIGMGACTHADSAATDPDHPGGGFANTGRGFTYGR